jgi:hypothetical protein
MGTKTASTFDQWGVFFLFSIVWHFYVIAAIVVCELKIAQVIDWLTEHFNIQDGDSDLPNLSSSFLGLLETKLEVVGNEQGHRLR